VKREWMKWVKLGVELALIAGAIWLVVYFVQGLGLADGYESDAWIICRPGQFVNVREKPGKRAEVIGRFDAGDKFRTDWEIRDGWIHAKDLSLEITEGWIYVGYVSAWEPEAREGEAAEIIADGRVACREYCDGPRISGKGGWVKPGQTVQIWYWTPEWCVTNRGYIKTEFLGE